MKILPGAALHLFLLGLWAYPVQAAERFDLEPEKAIVYLLEHSRSYQKDLADLEDAQQDVRSARGSALPQLNAELSYTRLGNVSEFEFSQGENSESIVLQTAAEDNYSGKLNLLQPVFNAAVFNAIRVSRSYSDLAQHRLGTARNQLIQEFLHQYAQVLMLEQMVDLNRQIVEQTKAHFEESRLLHDMGGLSRYDLLRTEVEYLNSIPALRNAEKSLALAQNTLRIQLNIPPATELVLHEFYLAAGNSKDNKRSELAMAESAVEGYHRGVSVYKSDQWPTLSAFANTEYKNVWDMFSNNDNWEATWNAGLVLNIPLFAGFQKDARIQKGKLDLRRAEADLSELKDQIQLQRRAARAELERSQMDLHAWNRNVEAAEEGLQIARLRNENGGGSGLELRDAMTARKAAGVNLAQAQYKLRVAQIDMAHAQGTLDQLEFRTQPEEDR